MISGADVRSNQIDGNNFKGKDIMKISGKKSVVKKVLNVGGNDKAIPIPSCFDGWQHDLLDIDPTGNPDILCDARELWKMPPRQYDAIYCSHNLEHYFAHDVLKVLHGFRQILKKNGFAYIRVPNLLGVMQTVINTGMELDDALYMIDSGPIAPLDVIFGWRKQIEQSGVDFFAHKTGFSVSLLVRTLKQSGFPCVFSQNNELDISAYAFKSEPTKKLAKMLEIGSEEISQRASDCWESGRFAEAIEFCDQLVKQGAAGVDEYLMIADDAFRNDDFKKAVETYRAALKEEQESFQAHTGLIRSLNMSGLVIKAEAHLKSIKKKDPELAELIEGVISSW
jgi:tetratricopeptide (TPR) repeat protein